MNATSTVDPSRRLHLALWVAQVFLAFAFLLGGSGRAFMPIEELAKNIPWVSAVPPWVVRLSAYAELVGAVGLLLPSITRIKPILTPVAAACLALVMVMAAVFHLTRGEYLFILVNLWLGGLAVFIAWGRLKKAPIAAKT